MRRVGLTQRLIEVTEYNEVRSALDIRWIQLLEEIKFTPVILPMITDSRSYIEELEIDGVILTGGNDLSSFSNSELDRQRDVFESNLLEHCLDKEIPLFGVCRGMQLISVHFHGELTKVDGHAGKSHKIETTTNSKYAAFTENEYMVNSYHNYGLAKIGDEFEVLARSEDGLIEAIEHKTKKVWAQMWHPERDDPFLAEQLKLIKVFFT